MKYSLLVITSSLVIGLTSWGQETTKPTLNVGDKITSFQTTDQHGKAFEVKAGPKHALVSFEMAVAKEANKQLEALGANYLPSVNAIYIANIYGMPKIGRVFAMPKMRRYPHQIILADQKGLLDQIPQKKDHITVLSLDSKGIITAIQYWNPATQKVESLLK